MAIVHPYKGYLNTEFHIYANGAVNVEYIVRHIDSNDSTPIEKGLILPNIPYKIALRAPGAFRIEFSDNTSADVLVEDGYKFGGSRPKAAYIFDNTPWCMVVMYDRTYFYNRKTQESYVEVISPDTIEEISRDYVIFKNNNHEEITLFSLNEQKPILCFTDMIYSSRDTIVWKDNGCLVIYSLSLQKVVHRIETSVYSVDKDKNCLLFGKSQSVLICELSGNYEVSTILSQEGKLITFVNNILSIYCSHNSNGSSIRIYKLDDPSYTKELSVKGYVARINDVELIDISSRRSAMSKFDLAHSDFPEAILGANFSEFIFYPCVWDVFYVQRETHVQKTLSCFQYNQEIHLKSTESGLDQILNEFVNKVIITDSRFVIYNNIESFVRSKNYMAAGYVDGDKILVYHKIIIRISDDCMYTLSHNGYWDNRKECNYDFSDFEEYGIVKDNATGVYKSLVYNINGKFCNHRSNPINHIEIGDSIILENGKILYNKSDLHKFSVKPLAVSPDLLHGITIESNKVYILDISSRVEKREQILVDIFDASKYHDVIFGEDGNQILYRDSENTRVTDIITGETFDFGNMSYVQQSNGMRVHFQRSGALQPRIVDPITGQMLDADLMKRYIFVSPDGSLYADTQLEKYLEYYYIEDNQKISEKDYRELRDSFNFPRSDKKDTAEWEQVKQRRINFVKKHFSFLNRTYPELFHNDPTGERWNRIVIGDNISLLSSIFIGRVIAVRGIAIIRNTSSDKEVARIDLGRPLKFLNYVSFSRDSRYVALAGYRNFTNGLFLIYDLIKQELLCKKDTSRAVWTTAFSVKGHLAAYTSDPNTIYFDNNYSCEPEKDLCGHLILNRNFLTFSPDGNLIALSDQGYLPANGTDHWGHQSSTFVEIRNANRDSKPLATFNDLSNYGIANVATRCNSVASVSFSNDNKRLMMVGNDGVVVIRNLHIGGAAIK